LNERLYRSQSEKTNTELKSAERRTALTEEKTTDVALTKLNMDSILFKQGVISKLEMTNSFDNYLNYKNSLVESQLIHDQAASGVKQVESEYLKTQNSLELKIIELKERINQLEKEKLISNKELAVAMQNVSFSLEEVGKLSVISGLDGEVINLFNQRYSQNFINKGDVLLSVTPKKDKFYAKVVVPQRDMRYIAVGQQAHLKIEAFNYLEKGVLHGTVSYVPERKSKEDFFVIVSLPTNSDFQLKAGYAIKGEIIVDRLKIYQYVLKKLFRKIDTTS
jgi:multidrug resistance efflux pump